jgi:hypothetical protein
MLKKAVIWLILSDHGFDFTLRGTDALHFCVDLYSRVSSITNPATAGDMMEVYAQLEGLSKRYVYNAIAYALRAAGSPMAPAAAVRYFTAMARLMGARYEN